MSQQAISNIENSETVEEAKLIEIAKALGVSVEALKNFSEEAIFNNISNFYDNSSNNGGINNHCTFNPLDKLIEAVEENKKLYERLLQAEKDKVALMEKLFSK